MSDFIYNDGGRAAAGFKGKTGDCVTRAIAIALALPYRQVYDDLNLLKAGLRQTRRVRGSSSRTGVHRVVYEKYLLARGWRFVPTMRIGSGCQVHLRKEELPGGRLICRLSRHLVAMVDGVIHDTCDPRRGSMTWFKEPVQDSRKAEVGRIVPETRCVYGYYKKEAP